MIIVIPPCHLHSYASQFSLRSTIFVLLFGPIHFPELDAIFSFAAFTTI